MISDTVIQNPVLYLFICEDDQIPAVIANGQKNYYSSIKYIIIDEAGSEFLDFVDSVHESLIKQEYRTAGAIRVNCYYSYKKGSHLLFNAINNIEPSLSVFYPGGITIDVYVRIDELDKQSHHRLDRILYELARIKEKVNMIYLFSSVNSNGLLLKENTGNIHKTISSLFFIKDTVTPGQAECIYDERYFCADAMLGKGDFYTAGCTNLSVPAAEINSIVTSRVIDEIMGRTAQYNRIWNCIYQKPQVLLADSIDDLRYIAVNKSFSVSAAKRFTNKQALDAAFGGRLCRYVEMNTESHGNVIRRTDFALIIKNLVRNEHLSIFEICNSIRKRPGFDNFFTEKLDMAAAELKKAEDELINWLDSEVDFHSLQNKNIGIFYLAKDYTDLRIDILNKALEYDTLRSLKIDFDEFALKAVAIYDSISAEHAKDIEQTRLSLMKMPPVLTESIYEYYQDMADKFLRLNMPALNEYLVHISESMTGDYFELIKKFCTEKICDSLRNIGVDKEITARCGFAGITGNELAALLFDTVMSQKIYNLCVKSEDKNKKVEIILIMDSGSLLAQYARYCNDRAGRNKISLAFEIGKADIDIVYQMGTFCKEELYYAEFLSAL